MGIFSPISSSEDAERTVRRVAIIHLVLAVLSLLSPQSLSAESLVFGTLIYGLGGLFLLLLKSRVAAIILLSFNGLTFLFVLGMFPMVKWGYDEFGLFAFLLAWTSFLFWISIRAVQSTLALHGHLGN